jgi:hypothetical protein
MKFKKIHTITLAALLISTYSISYAQEASEVVVEEETKPFTLSGSIDTYFRSSFKTQNAFYESDEGDFYYAPSTSFANRKGFAIGMVNLIASYEGEKVGFVGDVVFGPRGKDAVFNSEQGIVNQLYAYYKFTPNFTLNMGQFNTFLGYEVISPVVNVNYSTSYMFSYGPFTHTGLRADFNLGEVSAKLAVMNPTDFLEFNPVNTYTYGAQVGFGGVYLNFLYGDQDGTLDADVNPDGTTSDGSLFQADITAGWDLGDAFYLGVNTSFQSVGAGEEVDGSDVVDVDGDPSSFFGVAVYPKVTLSESFSVGLRAEYFAVKNGHLGAFGLNDDGDGNVIEITLSGNYKVGGFTFIPEFRIDSTSEDSFFVAGDTEPKKIMPSLTFAAVYSF